MNGELGIRNGEVGKVLDSRRERPNLLTADEMAEIANLRSAEGTLLPIDIDSISLKETKEFLEMSLMLLRTGAGNQDIVQLHKSE